MLLDGDVLCNKYAMSSDTDQQTGEDAMKSACLAGTALLTLPLVLPAALLLGSGALGLALVRRRMSICRLCR